MSVWIAYRHPDGQIVITDDPPPQHDHELLAIGNSRNACVQVLDELIKENRRTKRLITGVSILMAVIWSSLAIFIWTLFQ